MTSMEEEQTGAFLAFETAAAAAAAWSKKKEKSRLSSTTATAKFGS